MAKDMSFGGGSSNHRNPMSQETGFDISDLYQNEESIDLSNYITSANLELCDDELFQSLFPSGPETESNVKTEKPDPFESELSDWWTEPGSAYSSACSSAAPSPVQFFNTPPVTPKSDGGNAVSPEIARQQAQQERIAQFSMSRTQVNQILVTEDQAILGSDQVATVPVKQDPDSPRMNRVYFIKSEHDRQDDHGVGKSLLPELVKARPMPPSNYEDGIYGNGLKRAIMPSDSDQDSKPVKRSKSLNKESEEYKMKRERNNIAVRKSRDKAKMKSIETQKKVAELSTENKRLHERVNELTHELNTLKGILKSLPQPAHIPN